MENYESPLRSIRKKCLDCMGGSSNEVKACACDGKQSAFCDLFPYRFGKRPAGAKKRFISEERRKELAERMKRMVKGRNEAKVGL